MYNESDIKHATFRLPKPTVHPTHPFRDKKSHADLLGYIKARLAVEKTRLESRRERYAQIDRDVAAWRRLSDEDKKRAVEHARSGKNQATEVSLPLMWVHLDDMMTYYAQTFAPSRGMFYHTAGPDKAAAANQLARIMNAHATYGSYYRQLLRALFCIHKYNSGGLVNRWTTDYGPQLTTQADGTVGLTSKAIFNGNKIQAMDMYNLYMDPTVEPSMLHTDGEWFGWAEVKSHYWLKQKCLEGAFFNCEELFKDDGAAPLESTYYVDPPSYSKIREDESNGSSWISILSGADGTFTGAGYELMTVYIRLSPNDFGLIQGNAQQKAARNQYEIWRVTIANGAYIIEATHMNNVHNHLPCYFGVLADDNMREQSKGPAEVINPLQQFASHLMNVHVQGNRKNLYGTTFYDPSRIDYDRVPEGEVAARVPLKAAGYGKDIRTMVHHDNNVLDTKQTLGDLQGLMGIIDQFFPTQSLPSQIAGIDRAVDSQVAAVQQGSNRRMHKGARIIDDTMLRPMRFGMYYNIIQYLKDGEEITDFFRNDSDKVDIEALRGVNLVEVIGQGLKAIDRQSIASSIQQILFALIQAPQVGQQFDLVKLVDFWTSMMDIETSMEEFRAPPPAVGPDGQPIPAGAPAAGGTGIVPATNPESLTAPIYG